MTRSRFEFVLHLLSLLIFSSVASIARPAHAGVEACIDAHGDGQLRRDTSDFVAAAELFRRCADTACPDPIRSECSGFLAELDKRMPTVVFAARDADGADLTDVVVEVDGKSTLDSLTGRAVPMNPGQHAFVFRRPDGTSVEVSVLVLEGAKGRAIVARFERTRETRAETPAEEPVERNDETANRKVLGYALAAGGAVALGSFTYFALSGRAHEKELESSCAPTCSESAARSVGTRYLLADISLVVGVGLLGAGGYFYFSAPEEPASGRRALAAGVSGRF